jgi:hypothetical protein
MQDFNNPTTVWRITHGEPEGSVRGWCRGFHRLLDDTSVLFDLNLPSLPNRYCRRVSNEASVYNQDCVII